VMDHMRRKSIKLDNLKMIVLDEADEMLNMGFKEDIETILTDTPSDRQTVLFAATMPPAIMKITSEFLTNPVLIEIDKAQITIDNIEQRYIDVPHAGKKEALLMLIQYYQPNRAIIFCGTKKMADELTVYLNDQNVSAESIHSDIKQTQRTNTMQGFKAGKTTILIATDIAARGIDVNDVDYVFNYDIPPNLEYYIHRIGRTGRAGKAGCSITICGTKREANEIRQIAVAVKSEIKELPMPTAEDIQAKGISKAVDEIEAQIQKDTAQIFTGMVSTLVEKGYSLQNIAEAVISMRYEGIEKSSQLSVRQIKHESGEIAEVTVKKENKPKPRLHSFEYGTILLDIGSSSQVGVNHIIGAMADRTGISGKDFGKVNISENQSLVEIPSDCIDQAIEAMKGCKICGKPVHACVLAEAPRKPNRAPTGAYKPQSRNGAPKNVKPGQFAKRKQKR
ncbi:MAG: DEAD/DEAH box helicase, partial [Oscillospiraceae bacterium]